MNRTLLLASIAILPAPLAAQAEHFTRTDSNLVYAIIQAEDQGDTAAAAIREGLQSREAMIRAIAVRARERILDSMYAARRDVPVRRQIRKWDLPAWRERYALVTAGRHDCAAILTGLRDSVWAVRLHAADLAPATCAENAEIMRILEGWADPARPVAATRRAGGVSWHAQAHGITALARLAPAKASPWLGRVAAQREWHLRLYAARAASLVGDTVLLRRLVADENDNVKEAAIDALSHLTRHADDSLFIKALEAEGAQAVRAAAIALKGSTAPGFRAAAERALRRWNERKSDSERDVRLALLDALGRPASADIPRLPRRPVPREAVALALGEDFRMLVTMKEATGGGSFIIRLRGAVAPAAAARVMAMARDGYYNGTSWHRVVPDFVIQGGSHGDNEYVGYTHYFRDETGMVYNLRGTIGMSTRGHDTGDGQWFINLSDNRRLDVDYTVFGEVLEGMSAVDGIMEGDLIEEVQVLGED
jgi:cyclophilin family peptidyl-prolyl cis-trans isomerase